MMRSRYDEVFLRSIVYDAADIERRMTEPHVIELARNIRGLGGRPVNAPTVTDFDLKIIAGRDRLAALFVNGVDPSAKVWVNRVTATDEELASIEAAENILRRDVPDRAAKLAAYVRHRAAEIAEPSITVGQMSAGAATRNQGGKWAETPQGQAIREVAAAQGRKADAVRKEIARAEVKEAQSAPLAISALGVDIDADNARLDAMVMHLRAVSRRCQPGNVVPWGTFQRIEQEAKGLIAMVQSAKLAAKCPLCASRGGECVLCNGIRAVTEFQIAGLPPEQRPRPSLKAPRKTDPTETQGRQRISDAVIVRGTKLASIGEAALHAAHKRFVAPGGVDP